MSDPRRNLLGHQWLRFLLVVVAAFLANHASSVAFGRFDLTSDQRHTLSEAARSTVRDLDRPLLARVYFTANLEAPYNNHEQAVREVLEELRAYSGGQMKLSIVDPTGNATRIEEAQRFGIQPIQYRFRAHDRMELKQVFMGISFVYGDRQETVNPIATLETLEYEVARAIHSVTADPEDRKTVGYLQGNGEPDIARFPDDNPIGSLRERLLQSYSLRPVVLGGDVPVPEDIDALLVIGPQQSVPDRVQYQLDQYLMGGGPIAMFISSVRPDFNTMRAVEVRHDLNAMLGHYGVQLGRDALIDRTKREKMPLPVPIGRRTQLVELSYPLLPVTTKLNPNSPVVKGLDRAVVPFASSLQLAEDLPTGVEGMVWVETEETSASLKGLRHIRPDVFGTPTPGETAGPFPVAAGLTGSFTSFFANRPVPPIPGLAQDDPRQRMDAATRIDETSNGRLIVVTSADFIANNIAFVLNSVDWMLQDDELIGIRSRSVDRPRLEPPAAERMLTWKLAVGFGPAALVAVLGVLVWLRTRRSA